MSERPDAVRRMLEPRSVAVVGASARPGSFGERLTVEVLRSPLAPRVHLVHPSHAEVLGRRCLPTLADVTEPVDLVLLGVPDHALVEQLSLSAERGDRAAVVYGSARGLASEVASVAAGAGMALCGGGCMGFVNVTRGMRAIGYLERESLPAGPIALVTHSGSVFSALLRTRRRLEYTLAVSSGQELVTTTADYLRYALDLPGTEVVGLFVETMRDVAGLRRELERAARQDVAVVALAAGSSPVGRAMVGAHSGAVAGESAGWEALFGAYGVHPARDLDELVNTLELLAVGRRPRRRTPTARRHGIATVHDSGGERALAADIAHTLRLPFAEIDAGTSARLAAALDEGMVAANPLDVWGTGAGTEVLVSECLQALAADDAVDVTALAVDLVEEYDGDDSYPRAAVRAHQAIEAPLVVLNSVSSALDQRWADALRAEGIPVLEGLESGLRALRHLLDASSTPWLPEPHAVDAARRDRWASRLAACGRSGENLSGPDGFELLADYGVDVALPMEAGSEASVLRA
ncbi:MAG TPA: CoA-binding protein, partial [Candidatus Eisenbacteria bacterium]|nr:CoA-binding protein [Candidatus Eisenbacteria bacterium]